MTAVVAASHHEADLSAISATLSTGIDTSLRRRAEYSSDASNYRVVPAGVGYPRSAEEAVAVVRAAISRGISITSRGGGTSTAGNAVGHGLVLDFSRYMNQITAVEASENRALVQPGVVLGRLQKRVASAGLRFGPDPSTLDRATLGGMIGNNACGPRAMSMGRTADNVIELDVIDGTGRRFTASSGDPTFSSVPGLAAFVRRNLAILRTEFGRFSRQVSGYSLEHLLPENGSHLARALVGTEGTLVTVLEATVALTPVPATTTLVVIGYPTMADAADDVPALLAAAPVAIEGLDARLVDGVRRLRGAQRVPELPKGTGWLMVEVAGADETEALARAHDLVSLASSPETLVLPPGPDAERMWQIRADGAGLGGRTPAGEAAWPGWEDSAVPPERLGTYLRELETLMARFGLDGLMYGHFGDGCVHVRIDFPLADGAQILENFLAQAAELVASHGGSLSGEHGDGRARSALLSAMYSAQALATMAEFKALFDPQNLMNPGIVIGPESVGANLRLPDAVPLPTPRRRGFAFSEDGGDFERAVHRCVGVGKCRSLDSNAFMCPSYRATRDEHEVTRGRARVLQEAVNGTLVGGLKSPAVHDALDLCLGCKACASDCPAGVDMATFKSETLYRKFRARPRPLDHYSLGWLPRWARFMRLAPTLTNIVFRVKPLTKALLFLAGVDTRRALPPVSRHRPTAARNHALGSGDAPLGVVVLWPGTFGETFRAESVDGAIEVLIGAGYDVIVPDPVCCGLTWISTGQLDGARKRLTYLVNTFIPHVDNGAVIVGLEPSCTATLTSDLVELLPDDERAKRIATATRTVAQVLRVSVESGMLEVPNLYGKSVIVQPHCHQYATAGFDDDAWLLAQMGVRTVMLSGCCGLAGNFGMQRGHHDISVAVAQQQLLPALADMPEDAVYLADGFSCRTQAQQLANVDGTTLIDLVQSFGVSRGQAEPLPSAGRK